MYVQPVLEEAVANFKTLLFLISPMVDRTIDDRYNEFKQKNIG